MPQGRFCLSCTTVSRTAVLGGHQDSTAPSRTLPWKTTKARYASGTQNSTVDYCSLQYGYAIWSSQLSKRLQGVSTWWARRYGRGRSLVSPPILICRHATDLRISPLGVVPQRDCRPRPIVDYTFSSDNEATVKLVPPEFMLFGKALDRII